MRTLKTPTNFFYASITVIYILFFSTSCLKQVIPIPPGGGGGGNTNPPQDTPTSKIIYTDVDPDSVILFQTDSFDLDLNNDGIIDFKFHRSSFTTECGHNPEVAPTVTFHINLSVTPASGNNATISTASNFALALDSASSINSDSLWGTTAQILFDGIGISSCRLTTGHAGYWLNITDKYIGLKFIKDNKTYYGWARLSSTYSIASPSNFIIGGHLIIKDYAYNSVPDQSIFAGQTK